MKCIIVAYDKNRVIGANGGIPWMGKLPADMRHFRELTTGNAIVMGRKTFDSIGKALPDRQNIVVSRQKIKVENVETASSLNQAYEMAKKQSKIFIIGGAQIYQQAINDTDIIYATEIDAESNGDVFFPKLDSRWQEISRRNNLADEKNLYSYSFVTYVKKP